MADNSTIPRKKTLEELKSGAIAELERRGYDVRGKTPGKIRQILKQRPTKPIPTLCQDASLHDTRLNSREVKGLTGAKRG
jgi:hypothetical protein